MSSMLVQKARSVLRKMIIEDAGNVNQELASRCALLENQNRFLMHEIQRLNETVRYHLLGADALAESDGEQTRSSFQYQWADLHTGVAMANDQEFMKNIRNQLCAFTDLPPSWFPGKKVIDIGCGAGRYSYGLLSLGANVTASDQSEAGLRRTRELCKEFGDRLATKQVNLLEWDEKGDYDLVFCFGVVHHTSNTYLAMRNVARKVKRGGRLFLMIYGFPVKEPDFSELNSYEDLRQQLRPLSFDEKKKVLIEKFGPHLAHGWFDATSPRVNDILSFPEIADFLARCGFVNIRRTQSHRNHHLVAERA